MGFILTNHVWLMITKQSKYQRALPLFIPVASDAEREVTVCVCAL